jgi:CDP-diacylglycerol--glycerol-3-phosphate 3-phosphatidyltransferase
MATPPVERSPRGRGNGPRDYQTEFRNRLIESRLTPNAISLTGFALCVVAAALIWQGWWIAGGIAFIVGSVCDTLDGRYSRMSGKASPFGAFLDSTLDRVEEGVVLAAVAYQFSKDDDLTVIASSDVAVAVVVIAVIASIMVSYTRARAEALGVECKVGIADRAFRVVVLSAGLVFGDLQAIEPAVWVLAVMAVVTVFQRIFHVRSELKKPVTEAV